MMLRPGADCHGPSASSLLHHLCGGPQRHCPASNSNGERAQYPATQTSVVANERYGCCTAPSRAASSFDSPPYEMTTAVSKRDCYTAMGRHSIPVQKLKKANGPDTPTAPPLITHAQGTYHVRTVRSSRSIHLLSSRCKDFRFAALDHRAGMIQLAWPKHESADCCDPTHL